MALFGKPPDPDTDPADSTNIAVEPLTGQLLDHLLETFGYTVIDTRPLS